MYRKWDSGNPGQACIAAWAEVTFVLLTCGRAIRKFCGEFRFDESMFSVSSSDMRRFASCGKKYEMGMIWTKPHPREYLRGEVN